MNDNSMNKKLMEKGSLLCAAVSVLAFVLLVTMPFSTMIMFIGIAAGVIGIVMALASMHRERIRVLPMIGLIICALMLIAVIAAAIFSSDSSQAASSVLSSSQATFLN